MCAALASGLAVGQRTLSKVQGLPHALHRSKGGCLHVALRKSARGRRPFQQAQQAGSFGLGASTRCFWMARFFLGCS
jgi:hypothetical protein